MIRSERLLRLFLVVVTLLCTPLAASAQQLYTFTASLMGGFGGSPDANPGGSLDNTGFQAGFSFVAEPDTLVGLRVGHLGLGSDPRFGSLFDADLSYATVAGEYRFRETYYESGVYLGLGAYRLGGVEADGRDGGQTSLGVVLGITGEFKISRRFAFLVEFSGHYTDLDQAQLFAMGHAGVAYHF